MYSSPTKLEKMDITKKTEEISTETKNETLETENIVENKNDLPIEESESGKTEDAKEETKKTVGEQIQEIYNFITSIKEDVAVRNERDSYKDESIQRMSKQISDFEKGIFEKIKKELINEIISFYDLLLSFQKKFKSIENKELQNEIDYLETEISNILFNNSIDEIDENIGEVINRDFHKIKKKIETDNIDENQKIKQILKKGFIWDDKIIRKQEVIITEFKEKENIDE